MVDGVQQTIIKEGYDAYVPGPKKDDPSERMKGFLSLFIQQIKNRGLDDEPEDIFTKYAQMTGVEQGMKMETQMGQLTRQMENLVAMQMPNMIGQTVETPMDHGELKDGSALFVYSLSKPTEETLVHIIDDEGNRVHTLEGSFEQGTHTIEWDGRTESGFRFNDGPFRIQVEAYDHEGNQVPVPQVLQERIDGVDIKQRKVIVGGRLMDPTQINQMSKFLSQAV